MSLVQNQIEFNHPLQFSIALSFMAGCDTSGNKTYVDFNTIAPISNRIKNAFKDRQAQQLVCWSVPNNATDVEINKTNLIIRFKTERNHPLGIVKGLHAKLPGGWTWKFASKSIGFDVGYYIANGIEREFVDLSDTPDGIELTKELWNLQKREETNA